MAPERGSITSKTRENGPHHGGETLEALRGRRGPGPQAQGRRRGGGAPLPEEEPGKAGQGQEEPGQGREGPPRRRARRFAHPGRNRQPPGIQGGGPREEGRLLQRFRGGLPNRGRAGVRSRPARGRHLSPEQAEQAHHLQVHRDPPKVLPGPDEEGDLQGAQLQGGRRLLDKVRVDELRGPELPRRPPDLHHPRQPRRPRRRGSGVAPGHPLLLQFDQLLRQARHRGRWHWVRHH